LALAGGRRAARGSLNLRVIVEQQATKALRPGIFRRLPVCCVFIYLMRRMRDESFAFRFAGGGKRTDGRVSHRVQLDEVRDVLHGRVRQHDHGWVRATLLFWADGRALRDLIPPPNNILVHALFPIFWFVFKVFCFLFLYVWVRGTLPRFRYDQLMTSAGVI